jgi:iron complex outermembrane receptor protein
MLLLACCGVANAQGVADERAASPEEGTREAEALDVIVVSAERRDEPLQTSPISATVIAGDDLAKLGVNVVDQLQFTTPSATITPSATTTEPSSAPRPSSAASTPPRSTAKY